MMSNTFADAIRNSVLFTLRDKGACTIAQLKKKTCMHEVSVTIAIRDLQNSGAIEHGYLMPDGEWLDDYFPDEAQPSAAWRICK